MSWMERLEYMEETVEKQEEKEVERDTSSQINTIYDWEDRMIEIFGNYNVVMELNDMGENVTEAYNLVLNYISEMVAMGKTKFQVSDDRIKELFVQHNIPFDKYKNFIENNDAENKGKAI